MLFSILKAIFFICFLYILYLVFRKISTHNIWESYWNFLCRQHFSQKRKFGFNVYFSFPERVSGNFRSKKFDEKFYPKKIADAKRFTMEILSCNIIFRTVRRCVFLFCKG